MLKIDQNLIFIIINILILYWILKKFLFRPVTQVMEQRRQLIEGGISEAQKKQAQAEALKQQYEGKLSQADAEAHQILEDSRKEAKAERSRILQQADEEARAAMEKNRRMLEAQKTEMLSSVQQDVAKLALETAGKLLGKEKQSAADLKLYDQFLKTSEQDAAKQSGTESPESGEQQKQEGSETTTEAGEHHESRR